MKIKVIQIGNSKGIRLNKIILDKYHIEEEVELVMEPDSILIRPVTRPRKGWDESFQKMRERGDDALLIDDVFMDEDWTD